jgi:hypothetical protein
MSFPAQIPSPYSFIMSTGLLSPFLVLFIVTATLVMSFTLIMSFILLMSALLMSILLMSALLMSTLLMPTLLMPTLLISALLLSYTLLVPSTPVISSFKSYTASSKGYSHHHEYHSQHDDSLHLNLLSFPRSILFITCLLHLD